jgi:hypothetical protein
MAAVATPGRRRMLRSAGQSSEARVARPPAPQAGPDRKGSEPRPAAAAANPFRELDDLVLDLKGLVLVRDLRAERGAAVEELEMYGTEIERARDRLARFAREGSLLQVA